MNKKENCNPVTEESLKRLQDLRKSKTVTYKSGREVKVGDEMCFGLLRMATPASDDNYNLINTELISFHPEEVNTLYEVEKDWGPTPLLKVIK